MRLNSSNRALFAAAAVAALLAGASAFAQGQPQPVPAIQQTAPAISLDEPEVAAPVPKPASPVAVPAAAAEAGKAAGMPDEVPNVVIGGGALPMGDQDTRPKKLPEVKSMFFTSEEMASIHKAVAVYARILSGEGGDALDFLKRLQGGDKPKDMPRYFVYPQFFLASLVYHSQDDWSVYINNQKLTNKQPEGSQGIRVKDIDKDKVVIEWMPPDLQKVEDVWNLSPNDKIDVDLKHGKVTFTLRPNQTFSSYVMRVLEGKVMPMVLDMEPKNKDKDKNKDDGKDGKPALDGKKKGAPTERDFLDRLTGGR